MGFSCDVQCRNDDYHFISIAEEYSSDDHNCCECRQKIPKNTSHEIHTYGDTSKINFEPYEEDKPWPSEAIITFRMCERCADLAQAFSDLGYCNTWGELLSDYTDFLMGENKIIPPWLVDLRPYLGRLQNGECREAK